uniref:Addiction module component n=1 Tax=Candidatus Kentrum sp. FW TaxID=2126338 RepID=A0A450TXS9_9GAMM|nr:MAG: Putative addiction module component [Candidatus Kentron sp. FW]
MKQTTMPIAIPLGTMTTTDKLQAIGEIQADLIHKSRVNESESVPSLSWHADILRDREQRIANGASRFPDIAEAKQAVRERIERKAGELKP